MKYILPLLLLASCAHHAPSYSVADYQKRQAVSSPAQVFQWLKDGNHRFVVGSADHGGFGNDERPRVGASAPAQKPLAAIVACIDARTSPELVFDTAVGDLFDARVAGNVVDDDLLAGLELAADSGARVLVVLGHTDCGAVKGACADAHEGHLTQLFARIKPALAETNKSLDDDPQLSSRTGQRVCTNHQYISEVGHVNAQRSAREITEKSPILREKIKRGELMLVTGIYDVETGEVRFN